MYTVWSAFGLSYMKAGYSNIQRDTSQYDVYNNALHVAGVSRRQVKKYTHFVKNVKIVEFRDHIWNHHEKCIQMSTKMPSIG